MHTFRAMNTDVSVIAEPGDEPRIAQDVVRVFADAEQRFSRFRPDSELSQLNRARGPMVVSAPMFDALVRARHYVELTKGIFDPAIGATLVALGYDASFAPGTLDREHDARPARATTFLDLALDPARREVLRPADLQIDLGGMIKGHTVDVAAKHLPVRGAIDAGGDAVMRGGRDGWVVDIEDPRDPMQTIATIRVRDAAVATSAANRRKWRVARSMRHHLVDPRTQQSAVTDVLQATVIAPSAELADVFAKTMFVLGIDRGRAFLEAFPSVGAVLIDSLGTPTMFGAVEVVAS